MLSIKANIEVKDAFLKFCKRKGFTQSKVISLFALEYIKSGNKPFSLGEITNADENLKVIGISMKEDLKKQFEEACEKYDGVNMSVIIRSMMHYCVQNDCLPF